ncbi:MAG: class II aldolase/adducin family protein [Clostridia bacterium]|nr:class II aldolase/adducin family protein [Clostridia bacterium]
MIYQKTQAEQILLKACRELVESGLIARTWGNVSIRLSKDLFLITPSGRAYETLEASDLVTVNIKGLSYEGDVKPSSEKEIHASAYKLLPEVDFVVHTHQPNASALSVLGENFSLTETNGNLRAERIVTAEERAILGPTIPTAQYGLSSTPPLAANVRRAIRRNMDSKAILMKSHGAICFGATYEEAFKAAYTLEKVCGRIFEIKCGCKMPTESGALLEGVIDKGYMMHVRTPFIMEMSRRGKDLKAYLDDQAQISGRMVRCIESDDRKALKQTAEAGGTVLLRNDGALVIAVDKDEAEAAAIVLEKNCQAAMLALKKGLKPVDKSSADLEHSFYVDKYSKRKDEGHAEETD